MEVLKTSVIAFDRAGMAYLDIARISVVQAAEERRKRHMPRPIPNQDAFFGASKKCLIWLGSPLRSKQTLK